MCFSEVIEFSEVKQKNGKINNNKNLIQMFFVTYTTIHSTTCSEMLKNRDKTK